MAEKSKSGFMLGLSLFAIILLGEMLCFLVVDFNSVYRLIEKEDQATAVLAGDEQRLWVRETAEGIHRSVLYETGIWPGIQRFMLPPPEDSTKILDNFGRKDFFPYVEGRLKVVNLAIYLALYRVAGLITWLPVLSLFFLPLLLDAHYTRKRKQYNFQYASPTVQRIGIRTVAFMVITILPLLLISPLPVPPHSAPLMVLLVALAIWAMVRNLPKRI
tara:strand:- start:17740 stop:18390 length:651 start_codon:yes stop_codon:yes gene_type:complete